jgi:hypothetical protein
MTATENPDWGDPAVVDLGSDVEPDGDDEMATTLFPDFQTWVGEWLTAIIHRPFKSGATWCPEWWRHREAVARLDALWRAWEAAVVEGGGGLSYWWTMHFDSHFAVLSDAANGPFAACKEGVHVTDSNKVIGTLPCKPEPEDWDWPNTYLDEEKP